MGKPFYRSLRILQHQFNRVLNSTETTAGKFFNSVVAGLILLSTALFIVETIPSFGKYEIILKQINIVIAIIFTLEYFARFIAAPAPRWRYVVSIYAVIDLVALLPMYFTLLPVTFLRLFGAVRIFRLFKGVKMYSETHEPDESSGDAGTGVEFEMLIITMLSLVLAFTGIMYTVEGGAGTHGFETFFSSMWYVFVTIATIGYGDIVPVTVGGKICAVLIMITGISTFGIFSGIMGQFFVSRVLQGQTKNRSDEQHFCSACGHRIEK